MKKMRKNRFDERQEQQMLKIEKTCFYAFLWLILADILAGTFLGARVCYWLLIAVFLLVTIYYAAACISRGLFDRRLEPGIKTTFLGSGLAGAAVALLIFVISYVEVHDFVSSAVSALVFGGFTLVLGLVVIGLLTKLTKKRHETLEKEDDDD